MEISVSPGSFFSVDWAAVSAIAASAAALFTLLLWRAAKSELSAVLAATEKNNVARELELAELRRQVKIADEARQATVRPVVVVERLALYGSPIPGKRSLPPGAWPPFAFIVRNVGLGPALDVEVEIWACQAYEPPPYPDTPGWVPQTALANFFTRTHVIGIGADAQGLQVLEGDFAEERNARGEEPDPLETVGGWAWRSHAHDAFGVRVPQSGFFHE